MQRRQPVILGGWNKSALGRVIPGVPLLLACAVALAACGGAAGPGGKQGTGVDTLETGRGMGSAERSGDTVDDAAYEGVDGRGIPHYATTLTLSPGDAEVLRRAYGIEDPHRLYISDSTEEGILKYDTQVKRCPICYVNSYRVGYMSVRRSGESWEQVERRVRSTPAREFTGGVHAASTQLEDLDPDVAPLAARMLQDARTAGFHLRVTATYRSPMREAFLMAEGRGRTHTLTSNHSYGRALDIVVDDGNRAHAATKRDWIAFREWVVSYRMANGESFRILGAVDRTWDWPHVELPWAQLGFATVADALSRGRRCLAADASIPCDFRPHLPPHLLQTSVP